MDVTLRGHRPLTAPWQAARAAAGIAGTILQKVTWLCRRRHAGSGVWCPAKKNGLTAPESTAISDS
jgi:hypothetical protein